MKVFLTGASSGIGEAMARLYAARGATLGLVARRSDFLERLNNGVKVIAVEIAAKRPGSPVAFERATEAAQLKHGRSKQFKAAANFGSIDAVAHASDSIRDSRESTCFGPG